jgi:hypothetical protein
MPDEVENHILRKYEIKKRLGKGVCIFEYLERLLNNILQNLRQHHNRLMELYGKLLIAKRMK